MYEVRKFVLVDWYILDPIDIHLRGHTGIFGSNGSGKSSLIDALQVVMTGVNRRAISLNASADDHHRAKGRSIRDYCLGMVSDRKEGGKPLRDAAATRLAVVFERPETGDVHTIGVVLSAEESTSGSSESDSANFSVDSLFIATGVGLSQNDFVEWDGNDYTVIDWDAAKQAISRKADRFEEYKTSERYVSAMLALLRGEARADPSAFLRTFKNAVAFRPINNPTDFVRRFVLEDKPVKIDRFRDSVRAYEEINDNIEALEKREENLGSVENKLSIFFRTVENASISSWVSARAVHQISRKNALKKAQVLRDIEVERGTAVTAKEGEVHNLDGDKRRLTSLEIELQQHDSAVKAETKKNEVRAAEIALEKSLWPMKEARATMSSATDASKFIKHVSNRTLAEALSQIKTLFDGAGGSEIALDEWPKSSIKLDTLSDGLAGIDNLVEMASDKYEAAIAERAEKKRDIDEARNNLTKARQGAAPLSRDVETLHGELKGAGIHAEHLHALVRLTDERWQDVIESILGRSREILLVRNEDLHNGAKYLRENRKRFYGCRIFNNARIENFGAQPEPGTLASFIETDDVRARAFINQRLGNILAVENNKDLIKGSRAATADGMFNDGSAIVSLRPQPATILGKSAADMVPTLERMVETLERGLPLLDAQVRETSIRRNAFAAVKKFRDEIIPTFDEWRGAVKHARWTLDELNADLIAIEDKLPRDLKKEFDQLKFDIVEREKEIKILELRIDELAIALGGKRSDANQAREAYKKSLQNLVDLRRKTTLGIRSRAKEMMVDLLTKGGKTFAQIQDDHAKRAFDETKKISGAWSEFATAVRMYCGEYRRPLPEMSVDAPDGKEEIYVIRDWLRNEKEGVVQHVLRQFRAEALDAQQEMEQIFRTDFLAHLSDRFNQTRDILNRLNRRLKDSSFNDELYQFTTATNPEYEHIVQLVKVTSKNPEIMTPLFQAASARELGEHAPLFEAMVEVKKLLTRDDVKVEDFEDYRDYLTFEVNVCDKQGNVKTTLSSRQQIGSGGERQVPFYVAIAASLASMYHGRVSFDKAGQGLALALFDEAFNKLDSANMHACMDFFNNLGLQVLLAAPDEKRMEFTDNLDTVIDIERDRTNNVIMIDVAHPGPELKKVLRATNPAYRPLDDFRTGT